MSGDGVARFTPEFDALEHARTRSPGRGALGPPSRRRSLELAAPGVEREEFEPPWDVSPLYLRESDAEIDWERG